MGSQLLHENVVGDSVKGFKSMHENMSKSFKGMKSHKCCLMEILRRQAGPTPQVRYRILADICLLSSNFHTVCKQ